jgi:hypothetical protein
MMFLFTGQGYRYTDPRQHHKTLAMSERFKSAAFHKRRFIQTPPGFRA